jgi:hypothetical protein
MVWYGIVWYSMVWYGMVWYGKVWYGMVWKGIFEFNTATFLMKTEVHEFCYNCCMIMPFG